MHVRENSKQRDLEQYEARRGEKKIMVGQSGLVVVHFTPRFLSGWNRALVSSEPNYTILQRSKVKVVDIEVVAKTLIYPIEKYFVK